MTITHLIEISGIVFIFLYIKLKCLRPLFKLKDLIPNRLNLGCWIASENQAPCDEKFQVPGIFHVGILIPVQRAIIKKVRWSLGNLLQCHIIFSSLNQEPISTARFYVV